MPNFIPGLKLSELFYKEAVKPVMDSDFPRLKYAVARIDYGSEVLGFDMPLSMDHDWGPRLQLFLSESDHRKHATEIKTTFGRKLPHTFRGFPTNWSKAQKDGSPKLEKKSTGSVNHRVELFTIRSFFESYINFNPYQKAGAEDWLTFPQQKLRTIACGKVYYDRLGLDKTRKKFNYYPNDIWLYMLASQWTRIAQEEHLMGRSGEAGDEIGSAILGTRLIRDIMRLCFLMEKHYIPYGKWFGTGFSKLNCSKKLTPHLKGALAAKSWRERGKHLSKSYELAAGIYNRLKITKSLPEKVSKFHNRPYLVIWGGKFAKEIREKIKDKEIRKIKFNIGAVDQFSDSTDVLENPELCKKLKSIFR